MLKEGYVLNVNNTHTVTLEDGSIEEIKVPGEHVSLQKYYINFCGKFIGTILASDKEKANVRARSYFLGGEAEIEGRSIDIGESMLQYIVAMTELEYKELTLPIEDILEVFENK
jgi:hypothetical protein